MAVLSKETKSPLAPQSDDEVKKESDNTKSKNKKNDADEKADKAKIEPVKLILKDFNNAS
jgi:predicted GTPase